MIQYIIVIVFFVLALVFFGVTLHFSKFKRRHSGCCGGGHCDTPADHHQHNCGCYDEKVNFVEKYNKISKGDSCCSSAPELKG